MGCGKTLTAISVMGILYTHNKIRRVLVVAPSSVVPVWGKELEESADFPFLCTALTGTKKKRLEALSELTGSSAEGCKIAAINYESIFCEGLDDALLDYDADLIIADESQRIKTHDAAQSRAMHKLGDKARYKLILSGTPVQNSSQDLWSQYRFMNRKVFGDNFYTFRNRYCVMGGYQNHQIVGSKNTEELIKKEYSCAYRVTKKDALDLPEETFENRYVTLPDADRRLYDQIRKESYAELESGTVTATTVLTRLLRLQQITGGFLRFDDTDNVKPVNTAKLDALMEILADQRDAGAGKKTVVFARFTAEIDAIREACEKAKIPCGTIDGRTPTEPKTDPVTGQPLKSRGQIVEDFQTNPETLVFLAQIQTAGLGITLHAASEAVFYSYDFNFASYQQALARIHRIGQRHPVTYIRLIVEKSVDEKILNALESKKDLAHSIVDNWRNIL